MTKVYDAATDLITFARLQSQNTTSGSSYLGSDGLLKFAAEDEPRIEYAADGSLKGLLIEEQRTNYITSSQSLTVGVDGMFKSAGGTVTNSAGPFLDGSNDAVRIDLGVSDYCGVQKPVTSGQTYTFSFFAKPISVPGDWYITTQGSAGIFSKNIAADLVTDEWVRVHLTFTAAATTTQQFRFVSNNEVEAYIYGAQIEVGSFPTSYIPTSGSTVTRSPDIASIPVSAFGYNQGAGTVVVEIGGHAGDPSGSQIVVSVDDGSTGQRMQVVRFNGNYILDVFDGALPQVSTPIGPGTDNSKVSFCYSNNDFAATEDGDAPVVDQSGSVPTTTTMNIGADFLSTNHLNGHIKSLSYFPRRLTDAQLQELTA